MENTNAVETFKYWVRRDMDSWDDWMQAAFCKTGPRRNQPGYDMGQGGYIELKYHLQRAEGVKDAEDYSFDYIQIVCDLLKEKYGKEFIGYVDCYGPKKPKFRMK